MGILSTDAKTAIANGNPIKQYWSIWTPESNTASWHAPGSYYEENPIHGHSSSGEPPAAQTVIDAGTRSQAAYNVSLRDPGDLDTGEYTITVDVSNGKFNNSPGGYFYHSGESYAADPQQCMLRHQVFVHKDDGTYESLSDWYGRIIRFGIEAFKGAGGTAKQTVGTITARPICVDVLEQKWGIGDKRVVGTILPDSMLENMIFVEDDVEFEGTYVDHDSHYSIGWNYALTAYLTNGGSYKVFASIDVLEGGEWYNFTENLTTVTPSGSRLERTTLPGEHASTTLPEEGRISFWVYQDRHTSRGALVRPPKTPSTVWY